MTSYAFPMSSTRFRQMIAHIGQRVLSAEEFDRHLADVQERIGNLRKADRDDGVVAKLAEAVGMLIEAAESYTTSIEDRLGKSATADQMLSGWPKIKADLAKLQDHFQGRLN